MIAAVYARKSTDQSYALKQLITAGVRVFIYLEDRERTFDSPTDKLLMSVTAFADELERQKAAPRVYRCHVPEGWDCCCSRPPMRRMHWRGCAPWTNRTRRHND